MTTTAPTQLPSIPGIYHIVVAAGPLESQLLTYSEDYVTVTVLPSSGVDNDRNQEVNIIFMTISVCRSPEPFI